MHCVLGGGRLAPATFSFHLSPQPSSQPLDSEAQAVEPEGWEEGMLAAGNKGRSDPLHPGVQFVPTQAHVWLKSLSVSWPQVSSGPGVVTIAGTLFLSDIFLSLLKTLLLIRLL